MSLFYPLYYVLTSVLFQRLYFFFFLLPEKETDMTDLSLACIQPCPCQSLNGRLSTDLVESYVFPLVSSNPVPAGRVCPPGPPPHVPAAQICSPVSPRPCPQGTTPVPVTHVRHGVFLIPLPAVLDSLKVCVPCACTLCQPT